MLSSFTSANWFTSWAKRFKQSATQQTGWAVADRLGSYQMYSAYYNATIYNTLAMGGQREQINAILGNAAAADLASLYNPVSRVVDLYQHVLGGEFGVDILAIPGDNATQIDGPLRQIWDWSHFNTVKTNITHIAANYGDVGLRIVARNDADPRRRRVWIKPEHPSVILDYEQDERDNVTQVLLQYDITSGVGDDAKTETVRELQTKEQFTFWTVVNGQLDPREQYTNDLGVVPYVIVPHNSLGEKWGVNAYYRAAPLIDRINALQTHINVQIHRHVKAKLAVASSGAAPSTIDMSDLSIAWFNTLRDGPPPSFEWLVAPLNLADALAQSIQLQTQAEDELPELKATGGKFLAGQSGETIAQLRQPAEDKVSLARVNLEDGLIRAQKIGLSLGVLYDMWDLGTGMGTRDAADRAYQEGYEDHVFNNRPLMPMTVNEHMTLLQGKQALGYSRQRLLREQGMSDEDIAINEQELEMEQAAAADTFTRQLDQA